MRIYVASLERSVYAECSHWVDLTEPPSYAATSREQLWAIIRAEREVPGQSEITNYAFYTHSFFIESRLVKHNPTDYRSKETFDITELELHGV